MQAKLNAAPRAAIRAIKAVRDSRSKATCLRFFTFCCRNDDESYERLTSEGDTSLDQLLEDLRSLKIPAEELNTITQNQGNLAETIAVQLRKTGEIIHNARRGTKYPELSSDYIKALTNLKIPTPAAEAADNEPSDDTQYDLH